MDAPKVKEAKAINTQDWRTCPIPIVQMVSTVWINWRNNGSLGSIAIHHDGGKDYEMAMTLRGDGPHVVCTERVSSIFRSSYQMRVTALGSEIEKLKALIDIIRAPIVQHESDMAALKALQETESDPKHIADSLRAMEGWAQYEAELQVKIDKANADLFSKELELEGLLCVDLKEVSTWSFAVAELV